MLNARYFAGRTDGLHTWRGEEVLVATTWPCLHGASRTMAMGAERVLPSIFRCRVLRGEWGTGDRRPRIARAARSERCGPCAPGARSRTDALV